MKHFFSLFRFENIKQELVLVSKRFPLAVIVTLIFTVVSFLSLHGDFSRDVENIISRVLFSCVIVFFLSLGIALSLEEKKISSIKKYLLSALSIVFGVFFFYSFQIDTWSYDTTIYFILTLFGILAFLFFAPYIQDIQKQEISQDAYYYYFYRVTTVFFFSFILGGVLFLLGAIAIGSITLLFDINFSSIDTLYGDWAILSLALFAPLFGLTQFPKKSEENSGEVQKFFTFLIKFVAIPFIFLYFAILYAYTLKVLLNFSDWPKGEVSWLVIGFSSFGYLIYIFSYIYERDMRAVQIFRKYFPFVVLPQTAMLFYAIYLRIAQYDITINRYFVLVFGIWLVCISLYYAISQKKTLAFIPAIITIFTLLISIGPWSVYQLPESRQLQRLESNLTLGGILVENTIIIPESASDIDAEISGEIYEGIRYLCSFKNCRSLRELFPVQYEEILTEHMENFETERQRSRDSMDIKNEYWGAQEYQEPSSWEIVAALTTKLKVQPYSPNNNQFAFIQYSKDYSKSIFPLQVGEYEVFLEIKNAEQGDMIAASFNAETYEIDIRESGGVVESFSLSDFISELRQNYTQSYNYTIPQEEMTLEFSGNMYDVRLFITNIELKNPDYTENTDRMFGSENMSGYILLRRK